MRGRSPSPYDRRRSPGARRDRRLPAARERRRPRSFSPGPERARRSPTYKRFRRDEDYYDRYDRGSPGGYRRGYERDRYDDRDFRDSYREPHGRGGHRRDQEPQTYKEFMMRLPDEVTPEEASRKYQDYLSGWYGSQIKADFEQRKDEEWMREKYDPREVKKALERRKDRAAEMAQKFSEKLESGSLDPESPNFNQGTTQNPPDSKDVSKEAATDEQKCESSETKAHDVFYAPSVCWTPERLKVDWKLSVDLVAKLDSEKEITVTPILEAMRVVDQTKPHEESAKDETVLEGVKNEAVKDGSPDPMETSVEDKEKDADALLVSPPTDSVAPLAEGQTDKQIDHKDELDGSNGLEGKLDLILTYLWEVHLIDYYAGHELSEAEFASTKCRMIRPAKPEDKEARDEDTDKRMLEELHERVDKYWKDRLSNGSLLERRAQVKKVDQAVEDYIDSQVTRIGDKKWGNKLSTKLFVGREFVIKHIRLKHSAVVDAEREKVKTTGIVYIGCGKILDDAYFENYKKDKEDEERREQEQRQKSEVMMEGHLRGHDAIDDGHLRGSRSMGMGSRNMSNRGMMAPMVPSPMMGGPMGQVLMPAPGAGPLGPFILQPVPSGSMPGLEMGIDMQRSMGGNGMGSRGNMGRPGRSWGGSFRDYYDLDAPQNNRAVLDYGDL